LARPATSHEEHFDVWGGSSISKPCWTAIPPATASVAPEEGSIDGRTTITKERRHAATAAPLAPEEGGIDRRTPITKERRHAATATTGMAPEEGGIDRRTPITKERRHSATAASVAPDEDRCVCHF
jgi:hypothetical protein